MTCHTCAQLSESLEHERKARKVTEEINADEVLRQRTNLYLQIDSLQAEVDDLSEQLVRARKALGDHERDRATAERIEAKVDKLLRIARTTSIWCDSCQKTSFNCVCP